MLLPLLGGSEYSQGRESLRRETSFPGIGSLVSQIQGHWHSGVKSSQLSQRVLPHGPIPTPTPGPRCRLFHKCRTSELSQQDLLLHPSLEVVGHTHTWNLLGSEVKPNLHCDPSRAALRMPTGCTLEGPGPTAPPPKGRNGSLLREGASQAAGPHPFQALGGLQNAKG